MANEFLAGVKQGQAQNVSDAGQIRLNDQNTRAWDTNKRLNNAEQRQVAQTALNNKIKGYELDQNGRYQPSPERQQQDAYNQQLKELEYKRLQGSMELMQGQQNSRAMTDMTKSLSMGNQDDAFRQLNQNPDVKKKIMENWGVVSIGPVDWVNDFDKFGKEDGLTITEEEFQEHLKDPLFVNALNSSFFKTLDAEGNAQIESVPDLMKNTNYMNTISKEEQAGTRKRLERISEILGGKLIKTPEQQEAEEKGTELAQGAGKLTADMGNAILNDDTLTDAEKNAKLRELLNPSDPISRKDVAQTLKAEAEARVAEGTEEAKIKKAEKEANKGKLPTNSADFIASITDPKIVPYNEESLQMAKDIQGDGKLTDGRNKEVEGLITKAKEFRTLYDEMDKIDWDKDALTKVGIAMGKLMDPSLSLKEKQAYANTLRANTKLKALTAAYVKYMSGAAVTEGEFARYNDIISAGDWSNKESAMISMNAFTNYLREAAGNSVGTITDRPYDYLIKRQKYNKWATDNPELSFKIEEENGPTVNPATNKPVSAEDFEG